MNKQNDGTETVPGTANQAQGETPAGQGSATETTPSIEQLSEQLATMQASLEGANKRISELNKENEGRRKELAKYQEAEKARNEAQMTAEERLNALQNDMEAKNAELEAARQAVEQSQSVLKAQLDAQIKLLKVPEYITEAISHKPISEQLNYLSNHAGEFSRASGVDLDAGKGGKEPRKLTMEDFRGKSADWINANWDKLSEASK